MPRCRSLRRSARVRRRWLAVLVGLVLLAFAAPTIVGFTPLPNQLLASQLPADVGRLSVQSTSLSWTGASVVTGLELRDAAGVVILSADRVEAPGGVLALAAGDSAPLRVRVEGPRVDLVVGAAGTNFDPILQAAEAKRLKAAGEVANVAAQSKPRRAIDLQVVSAAVRVTDSTSGAQWLGEEINVELSDPGLGVDAIEASATGKVSAVAAAGVAPAERGEFSARLGAAEDGSRLGRLVVTALPLSLVDPLVKRFDATAAVTGTADVEGDAAWRPGGVASLDGGSLADMIRQLAAGGVRSSGAMQLTDVTFRGEATQGGPIRLATIDAPWRVATNDRGVAIQQLDVQTEVGGATLTGSVSPAEVERWSAGVAAAPRDLQFDGRLDFERLAAVAPQLVRLRSDTRIESGRVEAKGRCEAGRVFVNLLSTPLSGVAGDRRVQWPDRVKLDVAAQQVAPEAGVAGWLVEALEAESSFFKANAKGDAETFAGEADFDLQRLSRDLAGFIDLGGVRLAGRGSADFRAERVAANDNWRLFARGEVADLLVGSAEAPIAREPELRFDADLVGLQRGVVALPTGTVSLDAGEDRLRLVLSAAQAGAPRPFEATLVGDAARWRRRAATLVDGLPSAEALGLAGAIDLSAAGRTDQRGGRLDRFRAELSNLTLDTAALGAAAPRVRLQNERIEVSGQANWRNDTGVVRVEQAQFLSSVATGDLRDVIVDPRDLVTSSGEADFRVDLAGINAWMPPRQGPAAYAVTGLLGGNARLKGVPEGVLITLRAEGRGLALLDRTADPRRPKTVWTEPQLRLDGEALVTSVAGQDVAGQGAAGGTYTIDLRDARVESQSVTGSFGGRIADAVNLRGVEIGGGVDYDLEKITPMLWPQLGDSVRLVGRDRATFRIETDESTPTGAATIASLRARVAAPWQSADVFGLPIGPGRLGVALERGVARLDPLDVSIGKGASGEGRLTLTAAATLDPPPAVASLKPGPLLTNVAVSPEVNERVLKFIAPVLADATRVDGKYSLSLSELAVPLDPAPAGQPMRGRAAGVLDIHRVRVTPGPSVAQWVGVVKQIEGLAREGVQSVTQPSDTVLVAIENTPVQFQMVEGRVYHNGLQFYVGDALVQSSGSVGVADETLNIVLTVPILDAWVDRRPQYLGRLRGQALRIPVQGTFNRPKVNSDAFRQLSKQLIQSAGAGLLEGLLRKALE